MSHSEEILSVSDHELTNTPVKTIKLKSWQEITSSWRKRVEKGIKGTPNYYEKHEGTIDDDYVETSQTSLKSTGKGAKKRRAAIVDDEDAETDESDDEDD